MIPSERSAHHYPPVPCSATSSDSSFELGLRHFSATCLEKLHDLKESIVSELSFRFSGTLLPQTIRQAVNEADSLAASTAFPALFLPALAEEKVQKAFQWHRKQHTIAGRTWMRAA